MVTKIEYITKFLEMKISITFIYNAVPQIQSTMKTEWFHLWVNETTDAEQQTGNCPSQVNYETTTRDALTPSITSKLFNHQACMVSSDEKCEVPNSKRMLHYD